MSANISTVCSINVRSINNKSLSIHDYIIDHDLDILFLCETWLGTDYDDQSISQMLPPSYKIYHHARTSQRGGGVAVVFKESFDVVELECNSTHETLEYITCRALINKRQFILCSVYRPPSSSDSVFLDEWTNLLSGLVISPHELIICGDINLHLDVKTNRYSNLFHQSLDVCGLLQHVHEPTHYLGHTLDIFVTRDSTTLIKSIKVVDPMLCNEDNVLIKDHYAIIAILNIEQCVVTRAKISYRKLRNINMDNFKRDIVQTRSLNSCNLPVDTLVRNFDECLSSLLNTHAPLCTKTITLRKKAPWYDNTLICAKRKKRRLERNWRKSLSNISANKRAYREQCVVVNILLHTARTEYYSRMLVDNANNTKMLFKVAKTLTGHDDTPILPSHDSLDRLTDQFSTYFSDKIQKIKANITLDSTPPPLPERTYTGSKLTSFRPFTLDEVRRLIQSSPSKSCDLDPLPTHLLKECCTELLPLITSIINESITSGVYPNVYKEALVRPLIKRQGADKEDLKNYRPVSNLHFVSKLIEKAVSAQLESHLVTNELLDNLQSGYRTYHSTETAILKITNDILVHKDNKQSTALVSIDLSAAFDLVDHTILLKRLNNYFGVTGLALKWFNSYLSGRSQSVCIENVRSDNKQLLQGVPQGSVLGARLYTLYVRPLADILQHHSVSYHSYADDTQIYVNFDRECAVSMQCAIHKLEACISKVSNWMAHNGLKLNSEKTEWIIFNGNSDVSNDVTLTIGGHVVQQSSTIRNLGVILDSEITLNPQINDVCRLSYYHLRRVNKIRKYLTEYAVKTLVQALVTSRTDYCNGIYFGLPAKYTRKLQLVQNASARVIAKIKRREHITPVLRDLHWLPIQKRSQYKMMVLVFNALYKHGPTYITEYLNWYTPSRTLRSMNTPTLTPIRSRSITVHKRLLQGGCSELWNCLPNSIRCTKTFSAFKKQLKTYFFNCTD